MKVFTRFAGLLVAVIIAAVSTGAQPDHAPTKDQCRADAALWMASGEGKANPEGKGSLRVYASTLPYQTLVDRSYEMGVCAVVIDPTPDASTLDAELDSDIRVMKYFGIANTFHSEMADRLMKFINANGLGPAFLKATEPKP